MRRIKLKSSTVVLTKNENQAIIIGKDLIMIRVLEISGQRVELSIESSNKISMYRRKIYNKIEQIIPPDKTSSPEKEPVRRTISDISLEDAADLVAQREGDATK